MKNRIVPVVMLAATMLLVMVAPCVCIGEDLSPEPTFVQTQDQETDAVVPGAASPDEPFTWSYLATIAGSAAFTLLVVQFLKAPLDHIWKIPTRVFAYIIALATTLIATAFTTGLTVDTALLAATNAFIAALTAYGGYELTFQKLGK